MKLRFYALVCALVFAFGLASANSSLAACSFSISPTTQTVSSATGYYKTPVSGPSACRWTASTSTAFIHLHTVAGFGDGSVGFAIDANTGATRTGTIVIGGNVFTVTQKGITTSPTPAPTPSPAPQTNVVTVSTGEDLQSVLDAARPGDSIRLQAGAKFVGHFVLRSKGATATTPIIIRSTADASLFPTGRISPAYSSQMPKLKSPDSLPVLTTDPGVAVGGYVLKFLEIVANESQNDLVNIGFNDTTQTSLSQMPHDFEIDRCYLHGTSTSNSKRGLSLNANRVNVHDSYFADFHAVAQDSQAISGFNGVGNYTIENNYIEAAGENVMFGGDDPFILGLVQSHIVFRHNLVSRPMAWKGGNWQIKNLFELKLASDVTIEGNTFQNHWPQAQKGVAIVFTVRNQYGRAPQAVVGNVVFRYNVIKNVSSAIELTGYDNLHPSKRTHDITIENNLITVTSATLGGDGRFLNLDWGAIDGAKNLHVRHNTVNADGSSLVYTSGSGSWDGFAFEDNIGKANTYGFMSSAGQGSATLTARFPLAVFIGNVIAGGNAKYYPVGNLLPTLTDFLDDFVNFNGGNYALLASSTYQNAGGDGKDIGADVTAVLAAVK